MIGKLRRKFILIAMLSVIVVLGAIIAVINAVNYAQINSESDAVLEVLVKNEGNFPLSGGALNGMTAETPYEKRYFTVWLDAEGTAVRADVTHIAAVKDDEAKSYAEELAADGKTSGMYGVYKYRAVSGKAFVCYVFLDCSNDISTFQSFLLSSVLISAGGILLVLVLVVIFSKIALKPVEESYSKQKSFITNASHDIKTPLTIIGADAEVIEMDYGENEWSKDIKKQVARLSSLTDKLVFLSRMEEGIKPEMREFDFSEMLEEVCLSYEATAEVKGLSLSVEAEKGIVYNGSEENLRRAVALLMDNAVKYARTFIKAELRRTKNGLEAVFSNDADGLKTGNLNEYFDRFYRADGSRNSGTGGHGIGLSVVHSIVREHKGRISASSADGKVIKFVMTL